jgi:hypothetical protein
MKPEFIVVLITIFFAINTYYDNKYIDLLKSGTKYYQISFILFAGFSLFLFLKKNPNETSSIIKSACGMVKYMPVDKNTSKYMSPLLNLLNNDNTNRNEYVHPYSSSSTQRIIKSGNNNNSKRSVSETKKKFVASQQEWNCGSCNQKLEAWFEVDHKTRLDSGGTNHIDNLVALCRNCHGKKTAYENMNM